MKQTRIARMVACATVLALAVLIGVGCASAPKLSDAFQEDAVIEKAHQVIELCNEGDVEGLWAMMNSQMKAAMTEDDFKASVLPLIEEKGAFQSFKSTTVEGAKEKDTENDFAKAVVLATYEKGNIQYTLTFDTQMNLAGFFVK